MSAKLNGVQSIWGDSMSLRTSALFVLLLCSQALAQRDPGVYTRPSVPSNRDLDRLNLKIGWAISLPINSFKDGIATFQIFRQPHVPTSDEFFDAEKKKLPLLPRYEPYEKEIFVQTKSNILIALRESNGEEIWRWVPPERFVPPVPIAVNFTTVCVVNSNQLYLLDRGNGKLRHIFELPSTASAPLAADVQHCYVTLTNHKVVAVSLQAEDLIRGQRVRIKPEVPEESPHISLAPQSAGGLNTTANPSPSLTMLKTLRPPYELSGKDVHPSLTIVKSLKKPYTLEAPNSAPSLTILRTLRNVGYLTEINSEDKPQILWELQTNRRMENVPLIHGEYLIITRIGRSSGGGGYMYDGVYHESDDAGNVIVVRRFAEGQNKVHHQYVTESELTAHIGHYGQDLFAPLSDGSVVWVSLINFDNPAVPVAHIERFLSSDPIDRQPIATDNSLIISGTYHGMTTLERFTTKHPKTGEIIYHFNKIWRNPEAKRVFALNPKYVYASDKHNHLLVLDRARGLKLSSIDISGYNFPIVNQMDDRIFLAAQNGSLLCLYDKGYRRPVLQKAKLPDLEDPLLEANKPGWNIMPKVEAPMKADPKMENPKMMDPMMMDPKMMDPKMMDPKMMDPKQ